MNKYEQNHTQVGKNRYFISEKISAQKSSAVHLNLFLLLLNPSLGFPDNQQRLGLLRALPLGSVNSFGVGTCFGWFQGNQKEHHYLLLCFLGSTYCFSGFSGEPKGTIPSLFVLRVLLVNFDVFFCHFVSSSFFKQEPEGKSKSNLGGPIPKQDVHFFLHRSVLQWYCGKRVATKQQDSNKTIFHHVKGLHINNP